MVITNIIENTLRDYPEARNSDKKLILVVWEKLGLTLTPQQQLKFLDMPPTETIRRVRQAIQASGKYPADEKTRKGREAKAQMIQQVEPIFTAEQLENLTQTRLI